MAEGEVIRKREGALAHLNHGEGKQHQQGRAHRHRHEKRDPMEKLGLKRIVLLHSECAFGAVVDRRVGRRPRDIGRERYLEVLAEDGVERSPRGKNRKDRERVPAGRELEG